MGVSVDDTGRKKHDSNSTLNSSKTGLTLLPNQRIESTPLCNYKTNPHLNKLQDNENGGKNKLLSRSTIHNEFSPIIPKGMQWKKGKKLELGIVNESSVAKNSIYSNKFVDKSNSIIAPESLAVDNLLNDHGNCGLRGESSQATYPEMSQYEKVNSSDSLPFSRLSLNELTSLLVKTGKIVPNFDSEHLPGQEISPPYNVTRLLDPKLNLTNGNVTGTNGGIKTEIMEELDSLMLRLENVFEAYHSSKNSSENSGNFDKLKRINSVHLQQLQKEQDPMIIGQIVSEIVDQIHSFNYRCLGAPVKTQSHSSSPSIARSEGDGLSSPEPPVLSLSARTTQCVS